MNRGMLLVFVALVMALGSPALGPPVVADQAPFEVWLIDQQDTRPDGGGVLYIYDGPSVEGQGVAVRSTAIDLGGAVRDLCMSPMGPMGPKGSAPRRPHMLYFNGGRDDGPGGNTHAIIAFVTTGHVVFLNATTRAPVGCIDVGDQAHAAWPTPDQRYALVANQNGKLFQRIRTDYATNTFELDPAATINLATCTTPRGASCEDPTLRPDNAPICSQTDRAGRVTFVTLRGGGMFVVDHTQTPMRIVAEYDRTAVRDNGCGGIEANGKMYVNSGGGAPNAPFGHDVYAFRLADLGTVASAPNRPVPHLVYSRNAEGAVDAHGMAVTNHDRYLWVADRIKNDVTVVDTHIDQVVNRFSLAGMTSADPAPDLLDHAPSGNRMFVSLRGPNPATGGHDAIGSTPGLGIITVTEAGRSGQLTRVIAVPDGIIAPDPHAINVRRLSN